MSEFAELGEKFFAMIQTQQEKQKNSKTEAAKRWFQTPAYNIGKRRTDKDVNRTGQDS